MWAWINETVEGADALVFTKVDRAMTWAQQQARARKWAVALVLGLTWKAPLLWGSGWAAILVSLPFLITLDVPCMVALSRPWGHGREAMVQQLAEHSLKGGPRQWLLVATFLLVPVFLGGSVYAYLYQPDAAREYLGAALGEVALLLQVYALTSSLSQPPPPAVSQQMAPGGA